MTVYIEYAFLQNFLLDGALLCLALKGVKAPVRWGRLFLSACLGGIFAVCFPLLRLPDGLQLLLKTAVGFLLPLLTFEHIRSKKQRGRYLLSVFFFFSFTFAFGGALYGVMQTFSLQKLPASGVLLAFFPLVGGSVFLIKKIYQKRLIFRQIYPCILEGAGKKVRTEGFLDSGNVATKGGVPVCFLSADIFYELYGEGALFGEGGGHGRDEMTITTLAGEKTLPLYKGILHVKEGGKSFCREVYFAMSANMIGREYKVIFGADILGEGL